MRGKVMSGYENATFEGITPAHAGKSSGTDIMPIAPWDHPRACGEKTQEVTKYKAYDILHA